MVVSELVLVLLLESEVGILERDLLVFGRWVDGVIAMWSVVIAAWLVTMIELRLKMICWWR